MPLFNTVLNSNLLLDAAPQVNIYSDRLHVACTLLRYSVMQYEPLSTAGLLAGSLRIIHFKLGGLSIEELYYATFYYGTLY